MKRSLAQMAVATALTSTMGQTRPSQEVVLRPSGSTEDETSVLLPEFRVSPSEYAQRQVMVRLPGLRSSEGAHAFDRNADNFSEIKYLVIAAQNRFYQSRDFAEAAINAALIFLRTSIHFTAEVREYISHHAAMITEEGDPVVLAFHRTVADVFNAITDRTVIDRMLTDEAGRQALRILKNTGIIQAVKSDRWPPVVFDNVSALRRDKLVYDWGRHRNSMVLGSMNSYLGQVHASHIDNLPIV
jgi:hypothetical protein